MKSYNNFQTGLLMNFMTLSLKPALNTPTLNIFHLFVLFFSKLLGLIFGLGG
jgi:hypothetical protein